jgi:hypothetical protein
VSGLGSSYPRKAMVLTAALLGPGGNVWDGGGSLPAQRFDQ